MEFQQPEINKKALFQLEKGRIRLTNVSELWVGAGDTVFKANREGFWAGAAIMSEAPLTYDYDTQIFKVKATAGAASDVWLNGSTGALEFYYGASKKAAIGADSSSSIIYQSADNHYFTDTTKQLAQITGDGLVLPNSKGIYFTAGGNIIGTSAEFQFSKQVRVDGTIYPKDDNATDCGASDKRWRKGYFEDVQVDDLFADVSITYAGNAGKTFSHDLITSVFWDDANNRLRARRRTYTFTIGGATNYGAEDTFTVHDF